MAEIFVSNILMKRKTKLELVPTERAIKIKLESKVTHYFVEGHLTQTVSLSRQATTEAEGAITALEGAWEDSFSPSKP